MMQLALDIFHDIVYNIIEHDLICYKIRNAMREFAYKKQYSDILSPEIVTLISLIHEFKGQYALLSAAKSDTIKQQLETVKTQSVEASNRIEGIVTDDERLKLLVLEKTVPRTKSEKEIAGYRDVLSAIYENYDYILPRPSFILQLHRELYKFIGSSIGGSYKSSGNISAGESKDIYYTHISASETPEAIQIICDELETALGGGDLDPLVIIPMFILDFICIHPFSDGNGRMSRLLTLLLLFRSGYDIGRYISLEKLIADDADSYYRVLEKSSAGWLEGVNDYAPFVRYMLESITAAYREFTEKIKPLTETKPTKEARIRALIQDHDGYITKSEIAATCPDISEVTVERSLAKLRTAGDILKIGGGRYTKYTWNRDMEKN